MGETLNSLSRRFSDNGFLQGTSTGSDNTGICEDGSVGVVGKRQKLHSNPLSADYLLGYDNRHDIDDHPHTRQEYSIDSMNGLQASLSAINNMNTTHSSTFSHPTLTTTAQQIPTMCNATFNNTESVLSDHSSNETGAHLVDFATTAMGWSAYPSAHAHHLSVHGRVRYGLGHSLWQLSLLWSLVLSKTPFPYKLQETPSCGQSPTTGATIVLGSHPVMYGQHVCHGIYQQIRRYPLLQPEHLGNGHMALLLSELNTIINTIRSIPLQPSDASSCQFAHQTEWTLPRRTFLWLKRLLCILELPFPSVVDQYLFSELGHFIRSIIPSPPWKLVLSTLQSLTQRPQLATLITPNWPSAPWFPLVLQPVQQPFLLLLLEDLVQEEDKHLLRKNPY
ncbi:unnamed protein product [Rhizopus microsporus]